MTTGINVSTAHRLLQTLAQRQYIEQHPETRAYTLGPATVRTRQRLCQKHGSGRHLPAVHRAIARRDRRDGSSGNPQRPRSRGGLHGHRQSDGYGVARYRAARSRVLHRDRQGHACVPDRGRTGSFLRSGPVAGGDEQEHHRRRSLLVAELARVRANGFALDEQELSEDVCCVGVPIHNGPDRVIAAVSVAMPKARFRKTRCRNGRVFWSRRQDAFPASSNCREPDSTWIHHSCSASFSAALPRRCFCF